MKNRSSIDLRPDQVEKLNAIAESARSISRSGPTFGKPSWRTLVKDIADGRVKIKMARKLSVESIRAETKP